MMTLYDWLENRRVEEHLTARRFARRLGISPPMWSRMKSGERAGGMRVLRAALAAYPDRRDEVLSCVQGFPQGNPALTQVEGAA